MASELRVTTIANNAGTESVGSTYVINGSAKAWINLKIAATFETRDSFNISSVSDDGSGLCYTLSLHDALPIHRKSVV